MCEDCRAILRELQEAYREALSDPALRDAQSAIRRMVGGNEDDVVHAEQAVSRVESNASPRIGEVLLKMRAHEARTGHKVLPGR